ncbi:uncharacterized protein LOC108667400 isoform X2 [Hyalella azteca]|uniref:Uncharacterized protein LOC108667400 isoform X2 n=1 Tax=Hyalella azteca TaxID=294128 RepID=A0A979FW05_HYAAZ|nr:uncharacterized protein LOC108667400 isoform X2 [Hyalella azteca]
MVPHPVIDFAFTSLQEGEGNTLSATCKFCHVEKTVKFTRSSKSNLLKHLERNHYEAFNTYINTYPKQKVSTGQRKVHIESSSDSSPPVETTRSFKFILPKYASCTSSSDTKDTSTSDALLVLRDPTASKATQPLQTALKTLDSKPQCSCCSEILSARKMYKTLLQVAVEKCRHKNECCCKKLIKDGDSEAPDNEPNISQKSNDRFDDSSFLSQYDSKKGAVVHFCKDCLIHQSPSRGRRKVGESWSNGITFKDTRSKNSAKKRHLESAQHAEALELNKREDEHEIRSGCPTSDERQSSTKNSMIAGIFMATNSLPFVMYTALCALLAIICPSRVSHPLGNRHQSPLGIRNIILANYEACATTVKNFFATTFSATRSTRKFMICCSRGTAPMDVSRQPIVATYVADNGLPKEVLLDVSMIQQGDVLSTMNHFKETVSSFLDPSSIVFICTDEASEHLGKNEGFLENLKASNEYHNVIELPDFCHKIEKLFHETLPQWAMVCLSTSRDIASFIADQNVMKQIHRHINVVHGSTFTVSLNQSQTHSVENVQLHLEAILNNIQILFEALPELIHDKNSIGNRAKSILRLLINDCFVVRMMMIHRLCKTMLSKRKGAQDISFGPLEYKHQVDSLASELSELKIPSIKIQSFMKSGILELNFGTHTSPKFKSFNFEEMALKAGLTPPSQLDVCRVDYMASLIEENSKWIDRICQEAKKNLEIPAALVYVTESFSLHKKSFITEKLTALTKLFDILNVQFEMCGSECIGVHECTCLKNDYVNFMDLFQSEWEAAPDNKLIKIGSATAQSYTHAFAHYISTNNSTPTYPVNIIRCLEVIQLMKPTLAATERVMSHVAIAVRNKYEAKEYNNGIESDGDGPDIDTVQNEVFLRWNTNMVQHDADLAREIFLREHKESMMKTKVSTEKSRAVNNYLNKLATAVVTSNPRKRSFVPDFENSGNKKFRREVPSPFNEALDSLCLPEALEDVQHPVGEVSVDNIKHEVQDATEYVEVKMEPFSDDDDDDESSSRSSCAGGAAAGGSDVFFE